MERNQEGRRGSMAASATTMNGGGPSRRRQQRSRNLRVFPEDDDGGGGRMEMYRASSRSKRRRTRRGEGLVSNRHDGDDSSEESLGEDEEDDFFRFPTAASSSATNPPPPASSSSSSMHQQKQNHHARRCSSSKPSRPPAPLSWSVAEEMIGVPIPRKARSSSFKRSHESGGGGRGGDLLMHRRQSSASPSSPARLSPSSNTAMSPSSSNASVRKQKPTSGLKHRPPKVSKPSASSTQEIEIEVAEVLFGMTRQSPLSSPSRQESHHKLDSKDVNGWSTEAKSGASSPACSFSPPPATSQSQRSILPGHNLVSSTNSATAPRRKRPRLQFEKESLATRIQMELLPAEADEGLPNDSFAGSHLQESASPQNRNSVPEQKETEEETTAAKSDSCSNLDEATANKAPRVEKFSIDLMAPPPPLGNSELDVTNGEIEKPEATTTTTTECASAGEERNAVKCMADGIHSKKQILYLDLEEEDKDGLSLCGSSKGRQQTKQQQQQREGPRPGPKPLDKNGPSVVSSHPASLQSTMPIAGWPGNFPLFGYVGQVPSQTPQKRKRCATHCYIAQTIRYNQQIARMKPFWPPAAAGAPLVYGAKPCNPNGMLQSENAVLSNLLQGKRSFPGRSSGQLQDKASPAAAATANSALMEAHRSHFLLQQTNMLCGPAFIFPTAQQPAAATPSNQGICNSSPSAASVSSVAAGSGPPVHPVTTVSFDYPTLLTNDAQYLAFLQNNRYAFPTPSTHVGGGANPARAMPFFPGPFYSSAPVLNPAHSQQGHHNPSTSSGSSSSRERHTQRSRRSPGGAGAAAAAAAGGNSHSFPASKPDAPSPADGTRTSQAQKSMYGNSAVPDRPQNSAPIPPAAAAALPGTGAGGSGCRKEKQQPRQNQANLTPSHAYAMSFAAAAAGGAPGIDFSSVVQNRAFFRGLPEAARLHGYQQIAVDANASREEGKAATACASKPAAPGGSARHSLSFLRPDNEHTTPALPVNSSCTTEGSSRNANLMQLLANVGRTSNRSSVADPASGSAAAAAVAPANPTSGSPNVQLPQQQKQLQLHQQMSSRPTKTVSRQSSIIKTGAGNGGSAGGNGSPRASTSSKSGPASAGLLRPVSPVVQQPTPAAKNSPSSSSSSLGHPHITSASAKFQQQRFFSNSHIQAAQYCQSGSVTSFASFYQQRLAERRCQQQSSLCCTPSSLALAGSSDPAATGGTVSASAFHCTVSSPVPVKPPADQKAAAAPGNQC